MYHEYKWVARQKTRCVWGEIIRGDRLAGSSLSAEILDEYNQPPPDSRLRPGLPINILLTTDSILCPSKRVYFSLSIFFSLMAISSVWGFEAVYLLMIVISHSLIFSSRLGRSLCNIWCAYIAPNVSGDFLSVCFAIRIHLSCSTATFLYS